MCLIIAFYPYCQDGNTALIAASEEGHTEIVRLLLRDPAVVVNAQDIVRDYAIYMSLHPWCATLCALSVYDSNIFSVFFIAGWKYGSDVGCEPKSHRDCEAAAR